MTIKFKSTFVRCEPIQIVEALVGLTDVRVLAYRRASGDETSFVRLSGHRTRSYATTVADVANHQIIDILPTRHHIDVAGWIQRQPTAWRHRIRFGAPIDERIKEIEEIMARDPLSNETEEELDYSAEERMRSQKDKTWRIVEGPGSHR